ncbi:hypothetical protein IJ531_00270, partial [bacterium]|nr:hypothetical protein [bacterium]
MEQSGNVGKFKPIDLIMQGLQGSTDFNMRAASDESTINIFADIKTIMEKNDSAVGVEDLYALIDNKFDLNDKDDLMNSLNTVANMDGNEGSISLADFGIYEASYEILQTINGVDSDNITPDNIAKVALVLSNTGDEGKTQDELYADIVKALELDENYDSADLKLMISQIAARFSDGDAEGDNKIKRNDFSAMGSEVLGSYMGSETSRDEVKAKLKPVEEGKLPDCFKGARNDEVMHGEDGEGYWVVTEFWTGNEGDNEVMNTLGRVISNVYGDLDPEVSAALCDEIQHLEDNEGFFNCESRGSLLHGDALKLVELNDEFYARHPELKAASEPDNTDTVNDTDNTDGTGNTGNQGGSGSVDNSGDNNNTPALTQTDFAGSYPDTWTYDSDSELYTNAYGEKMFAAEVDDENLIIKVASKEGDNFGVFYNKSQDGKTEDALGYYIIDNDGKVNYYAFDESSNARVPNGVIEQDDTLYNSEGVKLVQVTQAQLFENELIVSGDDEHEKQITNAEGDVIGMAQFFDDGLEVYYIYDITSPRLELQDNDDNSDDNNTGND